jgi:hypothetical protein
MAATCLGGGGLRDAEVGRRLAEAAGLDDADEQLHGGDAVHGVLSPAPMMHCRGHPFRHGIALMRRLVFSAGPFGPSIAASSQTQETDMAR